MNRMGAQGERRKAKGARLKAQRVQGGLVWPSDCAHVGRSLQTPCWAESSDSAASLSSVTTGLKPVVTEEREGCLAGLSSVSPLLRVDFRLRVGAIFRLRAANAIRRIAFCLNQDSLD